MLPRQSYIIWFLLCALSSVSASDVLSLSSKKKAELLGWQDAQLPTVCQGVYLEPAPSNEEPTMGIDFDADEADLFEKKGEAYLQGHVTVRQGAYQVHSEWAKIVRDQDSRQLYYLSMKDYVSLWLPGFKLISDFADYNLRTESTNLEGVLYHFKQPWQGTYLDSVGAAKHVKKRGAGRLTLKDASYSTCPMTHAPWHIRASRLFVDQETGWASVTHARFYLGRIPVFYFPYYRFPISDQRQSGLLMPSVSYSSDSKLSLTLPLYLNLAPNMDATYSPHYRQTQGWIHALEWRGLGHNYHSNLAVSLIHDDRLFARFKQSVPLEYQSIAYLDRYLKVLETANDLRGSLLLEGQASLGRFWTLDWLLDQVSDPYVYRDLSDDEAQKTKDQLESKLDLQYHQHHWFGGVLFQQFQTLHRVDEDEVKDQYRLLPKLHIGYKKSNLKWDSSWLGEWTHFDKGLNFLTREQPLVGQRSYGSLSLAKPFSQGHVVTKPGVLLRGVMYQHLQGDHFKDESLHKGVPSLLLDQSLHFERVLKHKGWKQSLTPRLFALWTPYRDQNHLPQFDSGWQQLSYASLFSAERFVGHDRFSDEKRIAYGFESEFWDDATGQSIGAIKVGSGFAFKDRKVCLESPCDDDTAQDRVSPVAADLSLNLRQDREIKASWVWLPERHHVDNASLTWRYQSSPSRMMDLSYLYKRNRDGSESKHVVDSGLIWSIDQHWQGLGGIAYDLMKHHPSKSYFGVNYESCCWATRLITTRELKTQHETLGTNYDYGVKLQVMLKGLGTVGPSVSKTMVKNFSPQYNDPYESGVLGS